MILAIDTATRFASLALYGEAGVRAEATWRSANNHSVEVMPEIARMLARPGLDVNALEAVAVTKGPGSFTGLRIGMSIAKGLCLALDLPIIAVPTLEVVAYAVGDPGGPVLAVLEAGRGRICVARYHFEEGLPVQEGDWELWKTDEWQVEAKERLLVAGEVSADLADHLSHQQDADNIAITSLAGSVRRAGYLAELAWDRLLDEQTDDLDTLSPIYVHPALGEKPA